MAQINYNLKARRKNMRCAKFECDMAKSFSGAFKEIVEDNKRMKDALLLFFIAFFRITSYFEIFFQQRLKSMSSLP